MDVSEVAGILLEREQTVSVAEADTCGLIGYMLGTVPGASKFFPGGVIAYTGGLKQKILGVSDELYDTYALSDDTHDRAAELLGQQALIELVTIAGFYSMIALTLNAFEAPTSEGGPPPLDD